MKFIHGFTIFPQPRFFWLLFQYSCQNTFNACVCVCVCVCSLLSRVQRYVTSFQMFNLDLEKAEGPEIKLPTSIGSLKKQESPRKTSISALLTMPKPLTVWITINCGKFWKRWEYQTTWPASREICMQVRKQQLELGMEQQTGSKSKRSMSRLYIVTLLI